MNDRPRRPWHRKRRWRWPLWALLAGHLYVLSSGPAFYAVDFGLLGRGTWFFYVPVFLAALPLSLNDEAVRFWDRCERLGERHAARWIAPD